MGEDTQNFLLMFWPLSTNSFGSPLALCRSGLQLCLDKYQIGPLNCANLVVINFPKKCKDFMIEVIELAEKEGYKIAFGDI